MEIKLASDYLVLATFLLLGVAFAVITFASARLVAPWNPVAEKLETYECGVVPVGMPWVQFRVGYYLYAVLFVIFDVETVFLFPWAAVYADLYAKLGPWMLGEMALFLGVLLIGLIYAWKEGALAWR